MLSGQSRRPSGIQKNLPYTLGGRKFQTAVAGLELHLVAGYFGTGHHADEHAAARLRIEVRLRTSTLEPEPCPQLQVNALEVVRRGLGDLRTGTGGSPTPQTHSRPWL